MSQTIPVVWTNDDIAFGLAAELRRMLEFLDRHKVPGLFFLVPRSMTSGKEGDLDQDKELLGVIEKARENGHEFHQHGFKHDPYECGVPELKMLDFNMEVKNRFDEERDKLEEMHSFEGQIRMLEQGRRIWRRAFGEDPKGFRPPWGAYCGNLYRALAALGFEWISSQIPCFTGWERQTGKWDAPIHFRDKFRTDPHLVHGVMEFPMAGDYEIFVPNDPQKMDAMVELGMQEFDEFCKRGHPMVHCTHWHGLRNPGNVTPGTEHLPPLPTGTGYAIHERLIGAMQSSGRATFVNMRELSQKYRLSLGKN